MTFSRTLNLALLSVSGLIASTLAQAANCSVTATTTAFGTYASANPAPVDTTGTITVSCKGTGNVSYVIQLSRGGSGTYLPRKMSNTSPLYKLNYNLYVDSARTLLWGDGTSGTVTVSDAYRLPSTGTETRNYTIYARLPSNQSPLAGGTYLDTITVTVID